MKTSEEMSQWSNLLDHFDKGLFISGEKKEIEKVNNEILWAHTFQDTIRSSSWLKNKSFSPGRWAAGYPMLYIIYRILQNIKPKSILELGLGESSKLMIQYTKAHKGISLNIIEQDQHWSDFFENEIPDVASFVTILPIIQVPIEYNLYINHYHGLCKSIGKSVYDFIIIDGPWGTPWHSRNQILEIIQNNLLAENFVIVMASVFFRF